MRVVDDDVVNQKVAIHRLQWMGHRIYAVASGQETVRRIPYDLVFMGCPLAEMDGYEASREVRREGAVRHTPIIAMTANAMVRDREHAWPPGWTTT